MQASFYLQVTDVTYEVVEGDPRNVLCETVEKHHADVLVVGNHGYGAIKRFITSIYFLLLQNLYHFERICVEINWYLYTISSLLVATLF